MNPKWEEIKALTSALHSCQTGDGIVKKADRAEFNALEYQRQQAQRQIADQATAFLKARGYTSTGKKRK